ncbi:MAG: lytic transglycosylase domain-containing protein [Bryobacterales bacterium]|nr:lytic transglycosylase domain-containing protein [Bryobacterales bacterium]
MRMFCHLAIAAMAAATWAAGAERVRLRNGMQLEVVRSEREPDGSVWLYMSNGNIQNVARQDVLSIEAIKPPGEQPATVSAPPPPPKFSKDRHPTRKMIDEAAWRHGLPPAIVHAVAQAESAYNQKAISPVGAIGVMQLMPYTAAELGANPRNEAENIDAGTRYLRSMLVKFQHHPDQVALAIAAYNAGPGAVDRYRGVPPYSETRTYVKRVIGKYTQMATVSNQEAPAAAAAPLPTVTAVESTPVPVPQVDRPTVVGLEEE